MKCLIINGRDDDVDAFQSSNEFILVTLKVNGNNLDTFLLQSKGCWFLNRPWSHQSRNILFVVSYHVSRKE
ncbi:unnamed protein product [Fusarium graminearum]|nr:unnamed protein product [Fusarium graminearum]